MLTVSERDEESMILKTWMLGGVFFALSFPVLMLMFNDERRQQAFRLIMASVGLLVAGEMVLWYWEDLTTKIFMGEEWLKWLGYAVMVFFVVLGIWVLSRRKKMAPYEHKFYAWVAALFWVYALLLGDILNRVSHPGLPELLLKGLLFFCYFMLLNRLVLLLIQSEKGWIVTIKGWLARLRKKKEEPKVPPATPAKAAPVKKAVRKAVPPSAAPTGTPVKKAAPRRVRPDRTDPGRRT